MASLLDILLTPDVAGGAVTGGMNMISSAVQNSFNRQMMREQMAYNSPQNQMKMMVEAGINPNAAAQGVSGSPATASAAQSAGLPQMPDLGQLYGQSVNNQLQADLMPALKRWYESQAQGQENDNIVTGDSSVVEARKQQYQENLRKSVADADISEGNAEIILAEAAYAPTNAYYHALNLQQQHENLVKEFDKMVSEIRRNEEEVDLLEAQEGTERSKQRNLDADSVRMEWLNNYREKNGFDKDDPLWVKYSELMQAGKYDEAAELLGNSVDVLKKSSEAQAAGNFEGSSPANKAFATLSAYRDELNSRRSGLTAVRNELYERYKNKEIDFKEYQEALRSVQDQEKALEAQIKSSDRDYRKGLYITGTPTWWQDFGQQAPKIIGDIISSVTGIVVSGKVAGSAAGKAVKGSPVMQSNVGGYTIFNPPPISPSN